MPSDRRLTAPPALLLAASPLLVAAAHPAPEGTESEVGFGVSRAEVATDTLNPNWRLRSTGLLGHAQLRHRTEGGWTATVQMSGEVGLVTGAQQLSPTRPGEWTEPLRRVGDVPLFGGGAGRVGWHGRFFGAEGGVALQHGLEGGGSLRPSGEAWFGPPKLVYVWASTRTGPLASSKTLTQPFAGLGHQGPLFSWWLGAHLASRLRIPPPQDAPWAGGLLVEVSPGVRLGADLAWGSATVEQVQPDGRAMMLIQVDQKRRDRYW